MRVLTVCGSLERGGTDRVAQNFTLAYQRLGHPVAVLALFGGGPRQQVLESAGVEVIRGFNSDAFGRARDFKPDIIHVHRSGAVDPDYIEPVHAAKSAETRVIETNFFGRVDRSERGAIVDVHLLLSEWCLWRWHNWLGSHRRRQIGIVVPNAVETDDFSRSDPAAIRAFRNALGIPDDALLVGRVGQPHGAKWHPSTVDAFAEVAGDFPHAHLLLIGLPSSYRAIVDVLPPEIRRRIHEVPFLSSDAELCTAYSSLDCFLHASLIGETFGLVLTEAMLCDCPVVTAARPHKDNSQSEVVGHEMGGLVAGSTKHLGAALRRMLQDREFRTRIRPALRDRVTQRYSSQVVAGMALRAAKHALECGDRTRLCAAIGSDRALQPGVAPARIHELLYNTIGAPSRSELWNMRLRHVPLFERAVAQYQQATLYRKLRRMRRETIGS